MLMKVLVVDDSLYKIGEVEIVLKHFGISDYEAVESTTECLLKTSQNDYDLLISDLGLPLRKGEEVQNSIEGLCMLEMLAFRGVLIPTIINSTTLVNEEDLELLTESKFPWLGQATNITELESLIKSFLNNRSEISNANLERTRIIKDNKND